MSVGRWILTLGLFLVGIGLLMMLVERFAVLRPWRLPGDIVYRRKNFVFYFPLGTCLLVSILLTLLLALFRKR